MWYVINITLLQNLKHGSLSYPGLMQNINARLNINFKFGTEDRLLTKLMLQSGTSIMVLSNRNLKHGSLLHQRLTQMQDQPFKFGREDRLITNLILWSGMILFNRLNRNFKHGSLLH